MLCFLLASYYHVLFHNKILQPVFFLQSVSQCAAWFFLFQYEFLISTVSHNLLINECKYILNILFAYI